MLKMGKCVLLFSLLSFIIIGTLLAVNVHSAPSPSTTLHIQRTEARLTTNQFQPKGVATLPRPPPASEHNIDQQTSTTPLKELHFIKSSKCKLHRNDGTSKPICGYRQVDLPHGMSGVLLWRPANCQPYYCRCVPTKEVKRLRRTMANNKTTLDYHRFRVFECV